ncbi:recombinase family protein [Microvirga brassicacearum]|uniref:Recombinase family protein n=1 Tax=Microvirga brassicacearum TaxID=2580413 RepID=A0A5N3PHI8_9HYPH|nr:recombinase family protein [Microvirga brassicacearum]KAB0269198.1 recombinase family protein [Microvirga brassicacearum]
MKRAAISARYSRENQRDESIADQLEVCRRYAASLGFDVTAHLPKVLVHPNLAAVYRRKVAELESLLGCEEHRDEAMKRAAR